MKLNYDECFIEKFKIDIKNYCFYFDKNLAENYYPSGYSKNTLKEKINKDLEVFKININFFKKIISNYLKNKKFNIKEFLKKEILIDIFSPIFDVISKSQQFESIFTIPISIYIIKKFKEDYISFFKKMNKENINYSSIHLDYFDCEDLEYLKLLEINFNKIKRLTMMDTCHKNEKNYDYLFNYLFSFDGIYKLEKLKLQFTRVENMIIGDNLMKNINKCQSLIFLELEEIDFNKKEFLNLNHLETLILKKCKNIDFTQDTCLNIKEYKIDETIIESKKSPLKFPKLEEFEISIFNYENDLNNTYSSIIDFKSLINLKSFNGKISDFILLEKSNLLENVILKFILPAKPNKETEIKTIEKLISLKNLKKFDLQLNKINSHEISEINGINNSITEFKINIKEFKDPLLIFSLLKKFPNLTFLDCEISNFKSEVSIEIEENSNCKINNFKLVLKECNCIKLYCPPFEKIVNLDLTILGIINIE